MGEFYPLQVRSPIMLRAHQACSMIITHVHTKHFCNTCKLSQVHVAELVVLLNRDSSVTWKTECCVDSGCSYITE